VVAHPELIVPDPSFKHCPACGDRLGLREVGGRARSVCDACGWVHFRNPGVGAAVLVRDDAGRVLLIKRGGGATRPGLWCVPCGYVDYGEEVREAAARELYEETGVVADVGDPVYVATNFHDPEKVTVGIWFEGRAVQGEPVAGDDAVDVGWFALTDLPPLAFETDEALLSRLRDEAG
jgi:ADP-ribose pyrophosphatase YjhB (NUDIX family)